MPKLTTTLSQTQRTETREQTLAAIRPFASDQDSGAPLFGHDFRRIPISPTVQSKPDINAAKNAQGRETDGMLLDGRRILARDFLRAPTETSSSGEISDASMVARDAVPTHVADMPWLSETEMNMLKFAMVNIGAESTIQTIQEAIPLDDTGNTFALDYSGRTVMMTRGQQNELFAYVTKDLNTGFGTAVASQSAAEAVYAFDEENTSGGWSGFGRALSANPMTVKEMKDAAARARMRCNEGRAFMASGNFASAYAAMLEAREKGSEAWSLVCKYVGDAQSAAKTGLAIAKTTKLASQVVLVSGAIIATGGAAAAGEAAAETGATAETIAASQAASATAAVADTVALGASVGEDVAVAATALALGEKVDWKMFTVNIIMDVFLGKYGGKIAGAFSEGVAYALKGTPLAKELEEHMVKATIEGILADRGGERLKDAVGKAVNELSGETSESGYTPGNGSEDTGADWQTLIDLTAQKIAHP